MPNDNRRGQRRRIIPALLLMVVALVVAGVALAAGSNDGQASADDGDRPPADGTAQAENADGELITLPLVEDNGTPVHGDSTEDPRTPATAENEDNELPRTWEDLYEARNDQDWYVDGVNARKAETGFDWDDIERWADKASNVDARVIYVINYTEQQMSETAARDAVRPMVGDDVDHMPVVYTSAIVNTRGFGHEQMEDFIDNRQMVRVALAPIAFEDEDDEDKPTGLRTGSGVFVDCNNVFHVPPRVILPPTAPGQPPREVVPPSTPPTVPPGPPPTTPPTTTPPPETPPTTTPPTTVPPGHPSLSENCQQNGVGCPTGVTIDVVQSPQDNDTSGVDTGPTPGAPSQPPPAPAPTPSQPNPEPTPTGTDSGSSDGSGTPGGGPTDTTVPVDEDDHTGDPGGF